MALNSLVRHLCVVIFSTGILACSSANDKYATACANLNQKCKNEQEFRRALDKLVITQIDNKKSEILFAAKIIDSRFSRYQRSTFFVDILEYSAGIEPWTLSTRLDDHSGKISKTKVFGHKQALLSKVTMIQNAYEYGSQITIRTDNTPEKSLSNVIELCKKLPEGFCEISYQGLVDAIYEKSDANSSKWRGWIDISSFTVHKVEPEKINSHLFNSLRRSVYEFALKHSGTGTIEFINSSLLNELDQLKSVKP